MLESVAYSNVYNDAVSSRRKNRWNDHDTSGFSTGLNTDTCFLSAFH